MMQKEHLLALLYCSFNVGANIDLEVGVPSVSMHTPCIGASTSSFANMVLQHWSLSHIDNVPAPAQRFWSSLAGKYGNKFYWQDNGQEAAVVNAVRVVMANAEGPENAAQHTQAVMQQW